MTVLATKHKLTKKILSVVIHFFAGEEQETDLIKKEGKKKENWEEYEMRQTKN